MTGEQALSASGPWPTHYYDEARVAAGVAKGAHRALVGGLWDAMGEWQLQLMQRVGLRPHHRLLDVGCGALRGGVRLVPYLEPGRYHGVDLSASLLEAGYEREIAAAGMAERLPRANLVVLDDFDVSRLGPPFDRPFDHALAVSVFTHLPLSHVETALERITAALTPGGRFTFTYFDAPERFDEPARRPDNIVTHPDRDPFHHEQASLTRIAAAVGATLEPVPFAPHPRGQRPMVLTRAA